MTLDCFRLRLRKDDGERQEILWIASEITTRGPTSPACGEEGTTSVRNFIAKTMRKDDAGLLQASPSQRRILALPKFVNEKFLIFCLYEE
jgi:hypothetical protein